MQRVLIKELRNYIGKTVRISGWAQTIRNQKTMQFIVMRDHTGLAQLVHEKQEQSDNIGESVSGLTAESVVNITGTVITNEQVKLGGIEIVIESIEILSMAPPQLPIGKNASLETRMDWRFVDLRSPANHLIFRVQTAIEYAMRIFWQDNGFIEIHSPKLMETASESGGELFAVDYFDRKAYLAQSPQFYKQMAMAAGFNRVFEIGPVFRANPSFTSRHDTEFTSVDVEISFIESHEDIMRFEEEWLRFVLQEINTIYGAKIKETFGMEVKIPETPFPRITMEKAHEILAQRGYSVPDSEKGDLNPEGERLLSAYVQEQLGHEFVFVVDYPATARPFYHMRYDDQPDITKSFDLIWRGLEITTGAQREHRHDILVRQAKAKGLSLEPLQNYLNFFQYGCPPHGGYGFGLTRMLMLLLGFKNVREVTYLYRGPNRLSP